MVSEIARRRNAEKAGELRRCGLFAPSRPPRAAGVDTAGAEPVR